jgi:uncharacterized protein (TIGR00375 family)
MTFIADFHIHSHYSRATAKNLDLEHIYQAAQIKGITVVGTGDFTHPGWVSEISEKLEPAEKGLYALKSEYARPVDATIPDRCKAKVRFVLTSEISNIYKKNDRTRKNHNVLFMPDLDAVRSLNAKLDSIGNIHSDGRPILGLDAHHLLDMTLNAHDQGFLIPAHIWTPWFSLLGSKSGFDSIEECFEDLTHYIFAVETGLSSDPPMNRRVSFLDNLTLVSNSDAHSPDKLGREANLFETDLSYDAMHQAMKTGEGFLGTIEFYPEEGKYHLDGHRKCDVRMTPDESLAHNNMCPKCGKPLTLGVLYRITELADRKKSDIISPDFVSLIPLKEMLSEILQKGPKTKTVAAHYQKALESLGSEFYILKDCPLEKIQKCNIPLLSIAIERLRAGNVHLQGGYDGEFGTVTVFQPSEIEALKGQKSLFKVKAIPSKNKPLPHPKKVAQKKCKPESIPQKTETQECTPNFLSDLNAAQQMAVQSKDHHVIVMAGPGTGKTRTLTHRMAALIHNEVVDGNQILAVTFTQKAALEMKNRLQALIHKTKQLPFAATFHALCLHILEKEQSDILSIRILNEDEQDDCLSYAIKQLSTNDLPSKKQCKKWIETAKQKCLTPDDNLDAVTQHPGFKDIYKAYVNVLNQYRCFDFEDIIFQTIQLFQNHPEINQKWSQTFPYIFVDEYQDVNFSQYLLIQKLISKDSHLFVIGDPDQAIYGFRGSDVSYFQRFLDDYPDANCVQLVQNYRSTETILKVSEQVIANYSLQTGRQRIYSGIKGSSDIHIQETATEKAEAHLIVQTIEQLMGGVSHFSLDSGRVDSTAIPDDLSFSDFAVLYRTHDIGQSIAEAFDRSGMPFHTAFKKKQTQSIQSMMALLRLISGHFRWFDLKVVLPFFDDAIDVSTINRLRQWLDKKNPFSFDHETLSQISSEGLTPTLGKKWDAFVRFSKNIQSDFQGKNVKQCIEQLLSFEAFSNISINDRSYFDRLMSLSEQAGMNFSSFFSQTSLFQDIDVIPDHVEKISLLTMHAAKGLEFPVVFIAGCEDNLIPFAGFGHLDTEHINEERRVFYVALTRAKHLLYCTHSKSRIIFGKKNEQKISRFLQDVEHKLKTNQFVLKKRSSRKKPVMYSQQSLFC